MRTLYIFEMRRRVSGRWDRWALWPRMSETNARRAAKIVKEVNHLDAAFQIRVRAWRPVFPIHG